MAECRKKGVPQALYCKNGFVDTSARLLEKIERNSLIKQSPLSKDRDKRSSAFVFELSGEHWRVSRRVSVAAAGGRRGAELTAVALREGVCPEPGLLVSSSEPGRAVPGGAAGSTWIRPRLDPGCTAFKTLGAAVFLQTFKINGCPHPSFLKKLMEPFTTLTPRSGWCLCRPVTGCGAAAEFPQTASLVSRGPAVRTKMSPLSFPKCSQVLPELAPPTGVSRAAGDLPPPGWSGTWEAQAGELRLSSVSV